MATPQESIPPLTPLTYGYRTNSSPFQTNLLNNKEKVEYRDIYYRYRQTPSTDPNKTTVTVSTQGNSEGKAPIYYALTLSQLFIDHLVSQIPSHPANYIMKKQAESFYQQTHLFINASALRIDLEPAEINTLIYRWVACIPRFMGLVNDGVLSSSPSLFYYPDYQVYRCFFGQYLRGAEPVEGQAEPNKPVFVSPILDKHFIGHAYPAGINTTSDATSPPEINYTYANNFIKLIRLFSNNTSIRDSLKLALDQNQNVAIWFDNNFQALYDAINPQPNPLSTEAKLYAYYFKAPYHRASTESINPVYDMSNHFSITLTCNSTIESFPRSSPRRPNRGNHKFEVKSSFGVWGINNVLFDRSQLIRYCLHKEFDLGPYTSVSPNSLIQQPLSPLALSRPIYMDSARFIDGIIDLPSVISPAAILTPIGF